MPVHSYNTIEIVGRVGKLEQVADKDKKPLPIWNFSVAVDRATKTGKETDWFNAVCYKPAIASQGIGAGSMVQVKGYVVQDKWKDGDGNNRTSLKVVAESVRVVMAEEDAFSPISSSQLMTSGSRDG